MDHPNDSVANMVELACSGGRVAVAPRFGAAELVLLQGEKPPHTVALPYFGEAWAPARTPLDGDPFAWPKPTASVVATDAGVWCLSSQEGPWEDDPARRRRGRHVVHVGWEGTVRGVQELPFDSWGLATEGGRVLAVDGGLGVWLLPEGVP